MRQRAKAILAIVRKDVHSLLPLIVLAWAVFLAQPVVAHLSLEQEAGLSSMVQTGLYWLGFLVATLLMISVLQLDPAASLRHDWLTRPISRVDGLLAKLLFLVLTVSLPIVLARIVVNPWSGDGLGGLFGDALAIHLPAALIGTLFLFAVALLTPTLRQTLVVLVVISLLLVIPAWDGGRRLLALVGIDISNDFGSMIWVQALPLLGLGLAAVLTVYWLLYVRRRPARAWLAFGLCVALAFPCLFPPAAIYGWDEVIAIHTWMINDADDTQDAPDDTLDDVGDTQDAADDTYDDAVMLEHALACFPAASIGDSATEGEGADPVLLQAAWDEPILEQVDPGALTLATTVSARTSLQEWLTPSNVPMDVAVDWRIHRIRALARLTAESNPDGFELLRSTSAASARGGISPVLTDYWLVPGDAVAALAQDPTTRLILDYDLALLAPTPHELPTDGRRRALPGIGRCRAAVNRSAGRIEIDCIGLGGQPALVSAELVGVGGSRVDSRPQPAYVPDALQAIGRTRYEFALDHPNLVDSSVVQITAYEVERIMKKRLESPGLLGGPASVCPLPEDEPPDYRASSGWSDRSPHEVRFVEVEPGVQIEVLDWRTGDVAGKPVLFLIPGLGATAHSYDDLAPKLAREYGVVGMTRRGIGASSQPDHGYDIARLGRDVLGVLDALDVASPILVGHSIGGEELSYLGANQPDRFAGLIYLDAAYDRVTTREDASPRTLLLPGRPPPRPSELASYEALKEYFRRVDGDILGVVPEGEIMAMYDLGTGAVVPKFDGRLLDAIEMGLESPDYARIPLPALALFAVPTSPASLLETWYDRDDLEVRQAVEERFRWQARAQQEAIARFEEGVAGAQVQVLDDADHWIFLSNEQEVLEAIDEFVGGL